MLKTPSNLFTFLAYTAIIILTLIWSGKNREISIYNKHRISLQGIVLQSYDFSSDKDFFKRFLHFPLSSETEKSALFKLPDKRTVKLSKIDSNKDTLVENKDNIIFIKVRNGVKNLRKEFIQNLESFEENNLKITISEIKRDKRKKFFSVKTNTNINLIFSQESIF